MPGTEDTVVSRDSVDTQAKLEMSGDRVEAGPLRPPALPAHVLKTLGLRNLVPAPSCSLAGALVTSVDMRQRTVSLY